jgi:hypothetical protein
MHTISALTYFDSGVLTQRSIHENVTCAVRLETAFYGNSFIRYPFSATMRSLALIAEGLDIPSGSLSARFDPSI